MEGLAQNVNVQTLTADAALSGDPEHIVHALALDPLTGAVCTLKQIRDMASEMLEALRRAGQRPRAIILRMEQVPYVDSTGANALATFVRQAAHSGSNVWLCGLQRQPREFLARTKPRFAGARRVATWSAALRRVRQA